MSFGEMFDGYCVVHAAHYMGDRREWFEHELERVGVNRYTVVAAPKVEDDDPRVAHLKRRHRTRARPRISRFEALVKCIEIAKSEKWRNVVIMEDDIVFREQFSTWWSEVENEVSEYNWDILFLYRRIGLQIELGAPTRLIPIRHTLRTNCFVVREAFFSVYQDARSIDILRPCDSHEVFRCLRMNNCRMLSTSRNLSGEKGESKSSTTGHGHTDSLKDCFGVHEIKGSHS